MIPEHPFGWYVVRTIPDSPVSSTKLRRAWLKHELDPALVPKNGGTTSGAKVREAVRRVFASLMAVPIARDKLWFVHKTGSLELGFLSKALAELYKREDYEFHLIPARHLADKDLIERHLTIFVADRCEKLLTDINARLRNGKQSRTDRLETLAAERREIATMVEVYADMLSRPLAQAEREVVVLSKALEKLRAAV